VNKHCEWLLSLEFAIDFLTDDEISISSDAFESFQSAFTIMKQAKNERLSDLRMLVNQ
jgi:hypothetical protein